VGGANGPERAETATGNENEEVRDEEEEEVKRIVRGWGWGGGGGWDWVRGRKGGWFFPGFVGRFSTFVFFVFWWWILLVLEGFCVFERMGGFM
jgi:hypothetical protein